MYNSSKGSIDPNSMTVYHLVNAIQKHSNGSVALNANKTEADALVNLKSQIAEYSADASGNATLATLLDEAKSRV